MSAVWRGVVPLMILRAALGTHDMPLLARDTAETEIAGRGKRRHRSKEERRRIVEESLVPGASVAVIARTHGVNANQVFHWRKLYRRGPDNWVFFGSDTGGRTAVLVPG